MMMAGSWSRAANAAILLVLALLTAGFAKVQGQAPGGRRKIGPIQTLESARDYFNQGDYDRARRLYLEVLSAFPRNFDLLKNLGYCYYTMGRSGRARAVHFYSLAHKIKPGSRLVTGQLAKCLSDLNQHQEAVAVLRELAILPGADAESWKNLALEYDAGHRTYEAVTAYEA